MGIVFYTAMDNWNIYDPQKQRWRLESDLLDYVLRKNKWHEDWDSKSKTTKKGCGTKQGPMEDKCDRPNPERRSGYGTSHNSALSPSGS